MGWADRVNLAGYSDKIRRDYVSTIIFKELKSARTLIGMDWRRHYTRLEPHGHLGYLSSLDPVCLLVDHIPDERSCGCTGTRENI
jgi:hypothetical protein